jgi:hypothetical protein
LFSAVSDSSVLPHPTQSMNIRMFYEIIRWKAASFLVGK